MDDFNPDGDYAVQVELSRYWRGYTITQMHTFQVHIWGGGIRPERVIIDLLRAEASYDMTFKVVAVTPAPLEGVDPSYLEDEIRDLVDGLERWTWVYPTPIPD